MDNPHFTIIIPVFNEAANLKVLKQALDKYLLLTAIPSKVLFVDDGSTDDSPEILQGICATDSNYTLLSLDKNYGLSTALKAGFDFCDTPWIGYMDADLQTTPNDFMRCFDYMSTYNMVNGIRKHRSDGPIKKVSSSIANAFRNWVIKDNIADTCCPLKIIEKEYIQRIPFFNGMHRFIPALVLLQGGKVKEVEVSHFPRFAGKAKYHLFNRMIHPLIDTFVFSWLKKRQIVYHVNSSISTQNNTSQEKAIVNEQ